MQYRNQRAFASVARRGKENGRAGKDGGRGISGNEMNQNSLVDFESRISLITESISVVTSDHPLLLTHPG